MQYIKGKDGRKSFRLKTVAIFFSIKKKAALIYSCFWLSCGASNWEGRLFERNIFT